MALPSVGGAGSKATKEEIAADVAKRFPEITDRLPPHRKPWMSEDARMSLFAAVALGITVFGEADRRAA